MMVMVMVVVMVVTVTVWQHKATDYPAHAVVVMMVMMVVMHLSELDISLL
jgi:hypothetical protein